MSTQLNIGAKTGYSIIPKINKLGAKVETAATSEKILNKVIAGRLAAYAGLEGMVDAYLEKAPRTKLLIEKIQPPLEDKPYFLIFNENFYHANKNLVETVWNNIAKVRDSQFIQQRKSYYLSIMK
jgi:polar amino acid transport system substrate-binding protein